MANKYTPEDLNNNLTYLNETKQKIKQAIIDKGQEVPDTDTFRSYVDKIEAIETGGGTDTSDATATEDDILNPATAYLADGKKHTGAITATYISTGMLNYNQRTNNTDYYIFDYLPEYNIGLIGSSSNPTSIYAAQYNINECNWLIDSAISIPKATNNTNIISAKFAGLPIYSDDTNKVYEYYIMINGQNNGNYDNHYFRGVRLRIDISNENGIILFSLIKSFDASQYHSWHTSGESIYNICANPKSNNMFYYRICNSIRQNIHGVIKAIMNDTSISFSEQNNNGNNTMINTWLQFSEDGKYLSYYVNGTTYVATIDTSTNAVVKTNLGMNAIIKLNDTYYYFKDYNIYDFEDNKLTNYKSSYFDYSYDYCFWLNNILILCSLNLLYICTVTFDDDWNILSIRHVPIKSKYNPNDYSYKFTKLGHLSYRKNSLIYEADIGEIMVFTAKDSDVIDTVTIKGINYYSGVGLSATPDKVLIDKTYIANNITQRGTMPNNGELTYTPSTSSQTIPEGYTSGGTIEAVTSTIDNNIAPENIKKGATILGVEGTYTGAGEGGATSDVALQAKYLLEGYTAVVDDTLITGTMKNYGVTNIEPAETEVEIPTGYYDDLYINIVDASNLTGYTECLEALEVL